MSRRSLAAAALAFPLLAALAAGCTTHSASRADFMAQLIAGHYAEAEALLGPEEEVREEDLVPYFMDRGMALHLQGAWRDSDAWLDRAEQRIDELFSVSVTDKLQSLFWNDSSAAYAGEEFERVMVNIVRGFNFLMLDNIEGAAVEFRKVGLKLQRYTERVRALELDYYYTDDGFAHYLAALAAEAFGDENEALVGFRRAVRAYAEIGPTFQFSTPPALVADTLRVLHAADLPADEIPGGGAGIAPSAPLGDGEGELVVVAGVGHVAYKISEKWTAVDPDGDVVSVTYPQFTRRAFRADHVTASVDGGPAQRSELATNVSNIAIRVLDDRNVGVREEAVIRALAMYAAKKVGRAVAQSENLPPWARLIGAAVNVATNVRDILEVADTRSWMSLPDNYQLIRVRVPAGAHRLALTVRAAGGEALYALPEQEIQVPNRSRRFLVVHTHELAPPVAQAAQ